jgi:hypothetical protein
VKLAEISGTKRRNIWKLKLINLNVTVRSIISETCIGTSMISEGYKPRTNIGKDENDDLVADIHSAFEFEMVI